MYNILYYTSMYKKVNISILNGELYRFIMNFIKKHCIFDFIREKYLKLHLIV